jgi:hypothetical protein
MPTMKAAVIHEAGGPEVLRSRVARSLSRVPREIIAHRILLTGARAFPDPSILPVASAVIPRVSLKRDAISPLNCATTLLANSSAMAASVQDGTMHALFAALVEWNVRQNRRTAGRRSDTARVVVR